MNQKLMQLFKINHDTLSLLAVFNVYYRVVMIVGEINNVYSSSAMSATLYMASVINEQPRQYHNSDIGGIMLWPLIGGSIENVEKML